jgi:hypothetical protein
MRVLMIVVGVVAVTLPVSAQAATVTTDKACYRAGEEGTVTVGGFRPASTVDTTVAGEPMVNLLPDGNGGASAPFTPLASPDRGDVEETLLATDANQSPVLTAQTTYRVTATAVTMTPRRAKPSAKVTWKLSGFGLGTAYLHVARRNAAGKTVTVKTLKLGALAAPCGALTVRTKQLPLPRPEKGRVYELRFSIHRSATATAYVKRTVRAAR